MDNSPTKTTKTARITELESALEKALERWESCLRFKGAYLTKVDKDSELIDQLRKLARGN